MSTAETNKPATTGIGAHLGSHLRENGMMLALIAIVLFFFIIVRAVQGVDFLSAQNITNLFLQNSYVIIMALGMLLVIVAGHIDLSVGSILALCGVCAGAMMQGVTLDFAGVILYPPVWAVVVLTLMLGAGLATPSFAADLLDISLRDDAAEIGHEPPEHSRLVHPAQHRVRPFPVGQHVQDHRRLAMRAARQDGAFGLPLHQAGGRVSDPSGDSGQKGLVAISQTWPSGSAK